MDRRLRLRSAVIAFWNAKSVRNKREELLEFIERYRVDVVLISETWLDSVDELKLPNFETYRSDRPTWGGGVAILCKRWIDHMPTPTPVLTTLEATSIVVNFEQGPVKIVSAYQTCTKSLVVADFVRVLDSNIPVIVAGDLNAKHPSWNSTKVNKRGRELFAYVEASNVLALGPKDHTHFPTNGDQSDVLDIALTKDIVHDAEVWTLAEMSSDHNPVILSLNGDEATRDLLSHSVTSWTDFALKVGSSIPDLPELSSCEQLEASADRFRDVICEAVASATQTRTTSVRETLRLPVELRDLIAEKNLVRSQWQRYRDPADKALLNSLQHKVRDALRQHRSDMWARKCTKFPVVTTRSGRRCTLFPTAPPVGRSLSSDRTPPLL